MGADINDEYFVSLDEATELVSKVLFEKSSYDSKGQLIVSGKTTKKIKKSKSFSDNLGKAAGHIINFEDAGWIIISADKRTEALLAFSDENNFELNLENVPPGPRGWLSMVSETITMIRNGQIKVEGIEAIYGKSWQVDEIENAVANEKSNLFSKSIDSDATDCYYPGYPPGCTSLCQDTYYTKGPLLLNYRWGQRDGFNNLMPYDGCSTTQNGRKLTGCIPLAMAQVMRFHQQPSSRYNFASMPIGIGGSSEISRLIGDIGSTINMKYGCNNSWTYPWVMDGGFGSYSYGGAIYEKYDTGDYNIVKSNLNKNQPVLLEGKEKPLISFNFDHTWHVWVCDGYRTRYDCQNGIGYLYFHMNWGWYGQHNGWYGFQNWAPPGTDNLINHQQHIVHNIKP